MEQVSLPIFETPGVLAQLAPGFEYIEPARAVPAVYVRQCKTYREVCRMAWQMRRVRNMTYLMLAAYGGFYRPHVGDWFNKDDKKTRRDLPADCISTFEAIVGNTLVSQWIAWQSKLTVVEEIQAERQAA